MNALLEVKSINVQYGGIAALRNVSIQVKAGSVVCVIGANGAGKSSLINSISGVVHPSVGSIIFDNDDIHTLTPQAIARRLLLQVPEGRRVFAQMTVEDNLCVGTSPGRVSSVDQRERLSYVYALFPRLESRKKQMAGLMSGGEQQMLAIGRALMGRPRMLLLDEPSLGLAPLVSTQVFEALDNQRVDGLTMLLVEQNARKALQISDYGYVLRRGEIVKEAASKELLEDPEMAELYF